MKIVLCMVGLATFLSCSATAVTPDSQPPMSKLPCPEEVARLPLSLVAIQKSANGDGIILEHAGHWIAGIHPGLPLADRFDPAVEYERDTHSVKLRYHHQLVATHALTVKRGAPGDEGYWAGRFYLLYSDAYPVFSRLSGVEEDIFHRNLSTLMDATLYEIGGLYQGSITTRNRRKAVVLLQSLEAIVIYDLVTEPFHELRRYRIALTETVRSSKELRKAVTDFFLDYINWLEGRRPD